MPDEVDDFLAHFGVKGMQWGKTRSRGSDGRVHGSAKPTPLKEGEHEPVSVSVQGNKVATSGGRGAQAHEDAIDARVTKQRISSSGLNTVSNKDLQAYLTRVNLEQQYARMTPQTLSKGEKFARSAGSGTGKFVGNVVKDIGRETLKSVLKAQIDSALKK